MFNFFNKGREAIKRAKYSIDFWKLMQDAVKSYESGKTGEVTAYIYQAVELAHSNEMLEKTIEMIDVMQFTRYFQIGDMNEASEVFLLTKLQLNQRLHQEDHQDIAYCLQNLGELLQTLSRYKGAETYFRQALGMRQRLSQKDHQDIAVSLQSLAKLYQTQFRYQEAETHFRQVLEMRQRLYKKDHQDIAVSLQNLGNLLTEYGKYNQAEPLLRQALIMNLQVHPEVHPEVAISLGSLGNLFQLLTRYEEAEELLSGAFIIQELLFDDHEMFLNSLEVGDVISLLDSILLLPQYTDEVAKIGFLLKTMERLQENSKELKINFLPNFFQLISESEEYLAENYDKFLQPFETEKQISQGLENISDYYHPIYYLYFGDHFLKSSEYQEDKLENWFRQLSSKKDPTVKCEDELSFRYGGAESSFREAGKLLYELYGTDDNPYTAKFLDKLGDLLRKKAKYEEGESLLRLALRMYEKLYDTDHYKITKTSYNLACLLVAIKKYSGALELMRKANHIEDNILTIIFNISSESDRLNYIQTIQENLNKFISFIFTKFSQDPKTIKITLDLLLKRKGLSAAVASFQNQSLALNRYPKATEKLEQLLLISNQMGFLRLKIETHEANKKDKERFQELKIKYKNIERKIASQIPEVKLEQELQQANIEIMTEALKQNFPEGVTLIEFIRFDLYDFTAIPAKGEKEWKPPRYLAFILSSDKNSEIKMIDLGEAEIIDEKISKFRKEASDDKNHLPLSFAKTLKEITQKEEIKEKEPEKQLYNSEPAINLFKAVFEPLRPHLGNNKKLLISPDSQLNLIPFKILPNLAQENQLLMDEYDISYVSTGRDVLRFGMETVTKSTPALIMGDPDFELTGESNSDIPTIHLSKTLESKLEETLRRATGTGFLAQEVSKKLNELAIENNLYLRENALETHLTNCQSPRLILLATHGVAPEIIIQKNSDFHSCASVEDSMLLYGLALAGTNTYLQGKSLPPEAGKGIAVAQDIANLDLWGTEMAILSACGTGVGYIHNGEGVFGLRRAFTVAGCNTLIMSLWSVPDKVTALLMNRFFDNLKAGMKRNEALKKAQNFIRNAKVKDLVKLDKQDDLATQAIKDSLNKSNNNILTEKDLEKQPFSHPYYWGAWICQGDTQPLFDKNGAIISRQ